MGLVAVLCLGFFLTGRALRQIAIRQITELTNAKIEARLVDFNLDGSVFIQKLVIRPHQKQGDDDAILKAKTVYARFGIASLLLLRPRLKEISLNDFIFNAQHNLDTDQWNVAELKIRPLKGGSGKMPLVRLENGILKYTKVSNGQVKVVAAVPLDAKFGHTEDDKQLEPAKKMPDAHSFSIKTAKMAGGFGKSTLTGIWRPGNITIAGGISSEDIPAFERAWTIDILAADLNYDQNGAYSLKLKIKDLFSRHSITPDQFTLVEPSFWEKFGPLTALQKFFNRYRPAGRVDIDLEATGNLHQLTKTMLTGKVYCKDIFICDRKFLYPVEHLTGQIDLTEKSVSLNNLSGRHNNVELFFNGWSEGSGTNHRYQISIKSENMTLDNDLYNALSARQKKFWSALSPRGVAAIDYRLSRRSPTDKKKTLVVKLLDADAVYSGFPYPLKNLTGTLLFDRNSIEFSNLLSQSDEHKIIIDGKITDTGTHKPVYNLLIKADNIPLDSTLAASLSERQRYLYNRLNMTGLADAQIKVLTSKDSSRPAEVTANVYLKKASLKPDYFPLVVSDASASTIITPDLIHIQNLNGSCGRGLLSITGRIWPGEQAKKLRYRLALKAQQTQLNDELLDLLPPSLKKVVSELHLAGKINYSLTLDKAADANSPDYTIAVDCLSNSIDFKHFPYPLKDITGALTIAKDGIEFQNITATVADDVQLTAKTSTIKINGRIALTDNVSAQGPPQLSTGNIAFVSDHLTIKGKSLTNIRADLYYDRSRRSWVTENLIADCHNGRLAGKLELKHPTEVSAGYLLQIGFDDIDLKQFLSDPNSKHTQAHQDRYSTGRMSGSLSVTAAIGDSLPRIGRCRLKITDMQVGRLSLLAKLLHVLQLTEPKDFAFDQMLVDSYIKHNRLFFREFDLCGDRVAFNGSGWMDLQSNNIDLTLTARGNRLATTEPSLLQSLTEVLGKAVVRIEVTGNVYDPQITTRTLPVIWDSLKILGTKPTIPH